MFRLLSVSAFLVLSGVTCFADGEVAHNWPRFRGPNGTGLSEAVNLPTAWKSDGATWAAKLPVRGHSSPIIWGDRIFLTGTSGSGADVKRHVLCLDRRTQKVLWNKPVATGSGEKLHKMNSWATPSCVTDGERVVAFFGRGGLHCFDINGELQWTRKLGDFPGGWGVGASPIIVDDMVIQNCDAEGDSRLLAVNRNTGKDVWKTPRRSKPKGGWSTPVVIKTNGRREMLLNGEFGIQSYDPKTGKPLWFCRSFNGRGTPSPVWGHGLLYVVNGKPGDVYAVKPGGNGDITDSHMAWHAPRGGGRDLPSPVLAGNVLVVIGMKGIATGYDAARGSALWKVRLGGNYSSSPIVANGVVYAIAEDGTVAVMKPAADKCEVIAKNKLASQRGESFRSSMAISDGQLFMRSDTILYCIGERTQTNTSR